MSKLKRIYRQKLFLVSGIVLFCLMIFALSSFYVLVDYYQNRSYPNVYVLSTNVGGLAKDQILNNLDRALVRPQPIKIKVKTRGQEYAGELSPESINFFYNHNEIAEAVLRAGKYSNPYIDLENAAKFYISKHEVTPTPTFDEALLREQLAIISTVGLDAPQEPQLSIKSGEVELFDGAPGEILDTDKFFELVKGRLLSNNFSEITFTTETYDPTLSSEEAGALLARANKLLKKELAVTFERQRFSYKGEKLLLLLGTKGGVNEEKIGEIAQEIADSLNREPQNPILKLTNGRVTEFLPSKEGVEIKKDELTTSMVEALGELLNEDFSIVEIPATYKSTPPNLQTSDVNDLGITELIGSGVSHFRGSPSNRIHNIALAASKFDGVLIPPGRTFSFNDIVGDISLFSGYKQSFIIQNGTTSLGDGGGVCQVSTTLFRAALDAGLAIVERRQHSYRVGYYEQDSKPGIDATIFTPTVDFKFRNDTPGNILIQAVVDTKRATLEFDFYGTKDGRIAQITVPKILGTTAPPEDLYIDDPTKPSGYIEQIDYKAWGAKVSFDYKVTRGGEVLQDRSFYSNYQPWQAKFIRGTGPAQ